MGLRKELREFIVFMMNFVNEWQEWQRKRDAALRGYKVLVQRLEAQNQDLMDRLMARDLPEVKTYKLPDETPIEDSYDPKADENLAGEVVHIED